MPKVRVIPCLLLRNWGLEKGRKFGDYTYIGNPINAVRIYNARQVDELILLDIAARGEGRGPVAEVIEAIASEAQMPLTVGGGLDHVEQIEPLLRAGADRVVLNTAALARPELVTQAADRFGSQCIVVSLDAKLSASGEYLVHTHGAQRATGQDAVSAARMMADAGAGEILITSIDREGSMSGYDLTLTRQVADAVTIPVIAHGGAGNVRHLAEGVHQGHASAVAAGSLFLYFGRLRAVLINFPTDEALAGAFAAEEIRWAGR